MEADDLDHDSSFGGDRASLAESSETLLSFARKYQFEHGRRYHAYQAGKYYFPNDDSELDRMDLEHHNQLLQLSGDLHLCPLKEPTEILDLGTGTGIWAMDMGDRYESANVIGTDLSPIQPDWVPPNVRFEVDDFEENWTYGEERFDLIHHRFLMGSIGDYPKLYKNIFQALKPGAYLEISEMESGTFSDDGTVGKDSAAVKWWAYLSEAFGKVNRRIPTIEEYTKILEDAGFVGIECKILKRPVNDWPKDKMMKEIGRFTCLNFLEGLEGFTMAPFTRILRWTPEETTRFIAQVQAETVKRSIHAWQKGYVIYARRPEVQDKSSFK